LKTALSPVSDKVEGFVSASVNWKVGYCPRLSVEVEGRFPVFDKVEGYMFLPSIK
jgi:hypothetical protein